VRTNRRSSTPRQPPPRRSGPPAQPGRVTAAWVLLLTDEPLIVATVSRLTAAHDLTLHRDPVAALGAGPPALALVGADRTGLLPAACSGVPRLLLGAGPPGENLWRTALEMRAEQVVPLPEAEHLLAARLARAGGPPAHRALTVAVVGGCGGAGASVLAGAIARTAARRTRTLLVEVDQLGGGADLLLGAEDEPGLRWPDLASARGRLMPGSLSGSLPVIDGVHVLAAVRTGPAPRPTAEAVAAVLDAGRDEYGVLVVDLPRQLDDAAEVALRGCDACLVVLPAEVRATAAAQRVTASLRPHVTDLRLVVRGPAPTGLSALSICAALDLPLAGLLRAEPGLRAALDRGEPPAGRSRGPLARFCRDLLGRELSGARR